MEELTNDKGFYVKQKKTGFDLSLEGEQKWPPSIYSIKMDKKSINDMKIAEGVDINKKEGL